jgi:DNA (cytosine-5)-methyltransferase 1
MNVLDLFSGIGGFSLGLERAGMRTVAFCEIDPYCRAVLRKHWPDVPIFGDVRELTAADVPGVDVICGGFPCQDISLAGKGAGLAGERSGLWREYARLIGEIRPRYVIVENVAALLGRGLADVLGDLAEIGYDAEWHCIPASFVGLPQSRDRIWVVAYPESLDVPQSPVLASQDIQGEYRGVRPLLRRCIPTQTADQPSLVGMAYGLPTKLDGRDYRHRSRSLGNAVVPQIPEIIGRAIMNAERNEKEMKCS